MTCFISSHNSFVSCSDLTKAPGVITSDCAGNSSPNAAARWGKKQWPLVKVKTGTVLDEGMTCDKVLQWKKQLWAGEVGGERGCQCFLLLFTNLKAALFKHNYDSHIYYITNWMLQGLRNGAWLCLWGVSSCFSFNRMTWHLLRTFAHTKSMQYLCTVKKINVIHRTKNS